MPHRNQALALAEDGLRLEPPRGSIASPASLSLETALHDSEALNRSILEASADCIKIVSFEGEIQPLRQLPDQSPPKGARNTSPVRLVRR